MCNMNRREFLKWLAGSTASAASVVLLRPVSAASASSALTPGSYGFGAYGQNPYAGYQVALPLVVRGGS